MIRLLTVTLIAISAIAQETKPAAWIERSNQYTAKVNQVAARFNPEDLQSSGMMGLDEKTIDLGPGIYQRTLKANQDLLADLKKDLAKEKDPLVRQDLSILIDTEEKDIQGQDLRHKYNVPYFNVTRIIFSGLKALLDDQIPAERRPAAVARLRKYAGMEPGTTPLTELAVARTKEEIAPGKRFASNLQIEQDLARNSITLQGTRDLFEKYKIAGYEEPFAKLQKQLADYDAWVRAEILPKADNDFRLPGELYAYRLRNYGIDIPPDQLTGMAHAAFDDIQSQMQVLAAQVAKQNGYKSSDYRDVIHELKKQQIVGEDILPHYKKRLADIEEIIRRENLLTLPGRPARIKLASAAETVQQPAPHMSAPPLMNNHGEQGEFVLPLNMPTNDPAKQLKYDDFTFAAASWTLTAHEARPGHELQFDSMVERGVSQARALYAFNSVNVEGWGLYSEYITKPYMPVDGQLISLQHRLLRSARAYLDPELQAGKITPEQAKAVLMNDVVLSEAMANQEVERYTVRLPGQATSYFYGYTRLIELRRDVERELGPRFDAHKYHDFILSQGLLPPTLLRKAVMEEFVPGMKPVMVRK